MTLCLRGVGGVPPYDEVDVVTQREARARPPVVAGQLSKNLAVPGPGGGDVGMVHHSTEQTLVGSGDAQCHV